VNPVDIFFMVAMGLVLWLLIIRPQNQKQAAHDDLLKTLSKDDVVVTNGGAHGRVVEVSADTVVLELAEKVRITFDKTSIARRSGDPKPT
jgi:preprotein translocase subunit YajC